MVNELWRLRRVAENVPSTAALCTVFKCVEGRYTPLHPTYFGFREGQELSGRVFREFKRTYKETPHVEVCAGDYVLFLMPRKDNVDEVETIVQDTVKDT